MPQVKYKLCTSNKLPKRVTRRDFNRYILPCLKKYHKGPKPKLSYYKIFNYILYVLYTGCQWRALPIYQKEITWQNIHKWHVRWSKDGSYENVFLASVDKLNQSSKLDLSILHGDGSNTVAKKGASK